VRAVGSAVHVGEEPLVWVHAHRVRELGAIEVTPELWANRRAAGVRGVDVQPHSCYLLEIYIVKNHVSSQVTVTEYL